jgi:predicted ATPase
MFIISGGKGTGKTRTLLERAKAENGVVVCANPDAMRERAHRYGIVGLDIVSYDELYIAGKPVYIHDINKFIEHNMPEAAGYTLNID